MGQHFASPNPHEAFLHVRGIPAAPGFVFQLFGITWLFSAIFSQTTFPSPTAQKHTATLLKVSPWMEAAFVTKISVPCSNNSTQLFKKLC